MRYLRFNMVLAFTFIPLVFTATVSAREGLLFVPFQNIYLNPDEIIVANFAFGAHKIIFCYENNLQTDSVVTWPLLGQRLNAPLPLFLKTEQQIQGSFSDPVGFLTVRNTTKTQLIVNCVFGF